MNITRKLALLAGIGLALGTIAQVPRAEASPQVSLGVSIGVAPPPVRYERVPGPRAGYIWTPGYWNWSGRNYVWIGGTWYPQRAGYYYAQPRWVHAGRSWRMDRGGWHRGTRVIVRDRYGHGGHPGRHDNGRHGGRGHH